MSICHEVGSRKEAATKAAFADNAAGPPGGNPAALDIVSITAAGAPEAGV
ncbi:MAG: hypothetical protein ACKOB4_15105 [Acidobacteriota bacterium]